MKPYLSAPEFDLWHGDCIEVMRGLPADSVDSVVTDPPYELGFMGKGWDNSGIAYRVEVWAEALRVLKPGGHLLAFGGTRTAHRLACAIEDAGFDIRDSIAWMYGSGFPKSLDVSKAIDRKRDDRDDVLSVTAEIARLRDVAGLSNRELDDAFGFAGMAGHWTSTKSQPTVPTVDQWGCLRDMLHPDEWLDAEVWRLNGRKGQPGEAWAEREVTGQYETPAAGQQWNANYGMSADLTAKERRDNPATDAAKQWQGWGTALKPAHEPIVVARKPLIGTVAENVLAHGTGALNIGACRIDMGAEYDPAKRQRQQSSAGDVPLASAGLIGTDIATYNPAGRWPANVILDESQAAELDRQSGVQKDGVAVRHRGVKGGEIGAPGAKPEGTPDIGYGGEGGASRFFYTAKANSAERPRVDDVAHPTVKPLDLMRYLVRLVTPPGGVVLVPFGGSGTTIEACVIEGFRCVAIELTEEYLTLIAQRLTKPIQVTLL
jgi:DNA modification methylase